MVWSWREAVVAAGKMAGMGTLKGVRRATRIWFLKGKTGTRVTQSAEHRGLKGHLGDTALKPFLRILWGAPTFVSVGAVQGHPLMGEGCSRRGS